MERTGQPREEQQFREAVQACESLPQYSQGPVAPVQWEIRTRTTLDRNAGPRGPGATRALTRRFVMRVNQRLSAAAIALLFTVLSTLSPVWAQTGLPSQAQIDIFKSLTPEQQDAIMQQLGGSGGLGGLGGTGGTLDSTQTSGILRPGQTTRMPAESETQSTRSADADEAAEAHRSILRGDDWVIIEIDYQLPPRPLSPSQQQGVYASQGLSPGQLQALQQGALGSGTNSSSQGVIPGNLPNLPGNPSTALTSTAVPEAQLTEEEKDRNTKMMALIRRGNPYQLSADGVLSLPGFAPIPLAGLTDDNATMRLRAEPAFSDSALEIRLTRLPLRKTGLQALKPFGYDLFDRAPSTFAPVTNIPVPADYVVGAGDQLEVQLYGTQNRTFRLVVDRDGRITFPELGPMHVSGLLFNNVREQIEARVARQMIGVRASVSMEDTRAIRVFVLGEVQRAGSYTISGLGTITSALYAAGGVRTIGSLRNILLKRQGALVRRLDLYDLLIRGDTTDDTKLLPGDVIFIPPVGHTVSIFGEVRRPAIYEVKNESTVEDVLGLAGGLTPEADHSRVSLTRIDESQHRVVMQVDVTSAGERNQVQNGDILQVTRLRSTLDSGILLQGHVFAPGPVAYHSGLRLSDVIRSVDELRPNADIHYLLIRRELPPDRRIVVLSVDLAAALRSPGSAADIALMPRDRITAFDLASGRDQIIQPLMDELRAQSNMDRPTQVVHIDGRVKVPGDYPLESGMTVGDLVRAGGGLADAAYGIKAELTRYEVVGGESRRTELINIDLAAALRGDPTANLALKSFDNLSIKEVSEWRGQESVTLTGEVRFPGHYSIRRGETLRSVIDRAGGLTGFAFPDGAVFTREELRHREQVQMDLLAGRMQKDLTILAIQATATSQTSNGAAGALAVGQQLFQQLRSTKAVGRLVIDLSAITRTGPGSSADVILRNGDELIVPRYQQEVTVIGEVQNTTSHLYNASLSRDDYISMSGGTTKRADNKRIYVVRANGNVVANHGNRWFDHESVPIKPGDTVVVPLDAEHLPPLPYWQAITSILYNVAIAVAAVHAL
jgi:polysaccharide biosynthesis/export protein